MPLSIILSLATLITASVGSLFIFTNKKPFISPSPIMNICQYQDKDLCKFLEKGQNGSEDLKKGYRVTSIRTDVEGKEDKAVWESDGEKEHIINYENGEETFNMIIVKGVDFIKDYNQGVWVKTDAGMNNMAGLISNKQNEFKILEGKINYRKIGKVQCGKFYCFDYEMVTGVDKKTYIYFDDTEYLLQKILTLENGITSEMTLEYEKIEIENPLLNM